MGHPATHKLSECVVKNNFCGKSNKSLKNLERFFKAALPTRTKQSNFTYYTF